MAKISPSSVIDIAVIALIAGILLPVGLSQLQAERWGAVANETQNVSDTVITIWNNLDTLLIIGVLLGIVAFFRKR